MTNTESRIAIELEGLALRDDAQAFDEAEQQMTEADVRELALYGFDSEQRTLVGLGPVERARRSRKAAEIPDSQRAPQSESPGPFIADDEAPAPLPRRKLGVWAVAAPSLLIVVTVAVLALRGLASSAPAAYAASQPAVAVPAPIALPAQDAPQPPAEPVQPPAESVQPPAELVAPADGAAVPEPTSSVERARVTVPVVSSALPIKLPELAPPTVVDMSSGADANVGALTITSNPPANVVLDGRPLGKAPRIVKVPAGRHTVLFIHPLYGRQSRSVKVGAGATTSASADF